MKKRVVLPGGELAGPLQTGRGALIRCNGKTYRTSRVVRIDEMSSELTRFETVHVHYCLTLKPVSAAKIGLPVLKMAA